ncbi:MAG: hypothetical protein ACYCZ6_03160 [Polaromonas sp.]
MPSVVSQLSSFFLKLVLGLFAAIFAVSLLMAALIVVVLSLLASLFTGRKPAPAMVFRRFHRFSPQDMWPGGPASKDPVGPKPGAGQIVDVEVREVPEDKRQP